MKHQPFEEWLLKETPLDAVQKIELDAHLRICSSCSAVEETGRALQKVRLASPAAGFSARFQTRLALQRVADRRRRLWGAIVFMLGGLILLIWLAGPYLASFLASPVTWLTALIEWGIFLITTLQAIAQAGSVFLNVIPSFLSPFAWMVLVSALAGIGLLWSISIWRFSHRDVPRGV